MTTVDIKAQLHQRIDQLAPWQVKKLHQLLDEVFSGDTAPTPTPRQLGTMPGLIKYIAPDFDEPLEDFKEYMPDDLSS